MTINKEFIQNFNKSKSLESYREVYSSLILEKHECRICDDVIYYYDSTFKISQKTKQLEPLGKSFKSKKTVDGKDYYLTVCEKCLTNKFPEYAKKNKTRVFNGMNEITKFAFNIPEEVADKWVNKNYSITEKTLIEKYGEVEGKERWKSYCEKQAYSNTFEFKKEKWGWTEEEFKEYNKSRSVTLPNLVSRWGEEKGLEIWINYCDRQRYTVTLEYFIEKYGEEIGSKKYKDFSDKRIFKGGFSEMSQKLFKEIDKQLTEFKTFYATKGGEKSFLRKVGDRSFEYYLDYWIEDLNIGVEFNGDMWHANPSIYEFDSNPTPFEPNMKAESIWKKDKLKIDYLNEKLNKLIIVWEKDYLEDGVELTVEKILSKISDTLK
jgi:hypothetical protein